MSDFVILKWQPFEGQNLKKKDLFYLGPKQAFLKYFLKDCMQKEDFDNLEINRNLKCQSCVTMSHEMAVL